MVNKLIKKITIFILVFSMVSTPIASLAAEDELSIDDRSVTQEEKEYIDSSNEEENPEDGVVSVEDAQAADEAEEDVTEDSKKDSEKEDDKKASDKKEEASEYKPIKRTIIAHRGASGYLPDHTLESTAYAYAQGANYIEYDVVMTKDDELIVLHDPYLDRSTDVAERYPGRAREDGRFYAADFTLKEIQSLNYLGVFDVLEEDNEEGGRAGDVVPEYENRFPMGKSSFEIHTLGDYIELIRGLNQSTGRTVGIYIEIKAVNWHAEQGKDIVLKTMEVLKSYGYTSKDDHIIIQCFDPEALKRIRFELCPEMNMDLYLMQLIAYKHWRLRKTNNNEGTWAELSLRWNMNLYNMKEIAEYADGISPDYNLLFRRSSTKGDIRYTKIVEQAKENGLKIHPYTLRDDELPEYVDNIYQLYKIILVDLKCNGVFTDFPDTGKSFIKWYNKKLKEKAEEKAAEE